MLACWAEDPNGDYFKKHLARIPDYLWVAEDGMKMQVSYCSIKPSKYIFHCNYITGFELHGDHLFHNTYKFFALTHNAVIRFQSFGSQEWDAGFAIQALLASDLVDEIGETLRKGHDFIKKSQVPTSYLFFHSHNSRLVGVRCLTIICALFTLLQVKDNPSGDFKSMHRHISKGSWTFSDQDHGWQVSDCTAEGLKVCNLNLVNCGIC